VAGHVLGRHVSNGDYMASTWARHKAGDCIVGCHYCKEQKQSNPIRVFVSKLFSGRNRKERRKEMVQAK